MSNTTGKITPSDIEEKLRSIQGGVDRAKGAVKPATQGVAPMLGAAAVVVVFLLGYRRGRKKNALIEITRI